MNNTKIVSWNILNDFWADDKNYLMQRDRLTSIVSEIKPTIEDADAVVLFLCEVEDENIAEIAKQTGLVVVGLPHEYERISVLYPRKMSKQSAVFLADVKTAKDAHVARLRTYNQCRDLLLQFKTPKLSILGTHIPQRPFTDFFTRRSHITEIFRCSPDVVMGDFNATPLFGSRLRLKLAAKYFEAHVNKRPPFPSEYYRGRNIATWWPPMSIDALYYKNKKLVKGGYSMSDASDHPLIWAELL